MPSIDLHARLKAETAAVHQRLEALLFFTALQAGSLPGLALVSYMRCLSIVHAVLERSLGQTPDRRVAALSGLCKAKLPFLVADLSEDAARRLGSVGPAIQQALQFSDQILHAAASPLCLVGYLYVLEGSQNGGAFLRRSIAECLGVEEARLSYFGCYGEATGSRWKRFVAGLNGLGLTEEEGGAICRSAVACFEGLEAICSACDPVVEANLSHHIAEINPEAGDHAMPQDAAEIDLALRAARRAWDKYPYLQLRFGERGRRFTLSDSCWLVTLTRMPPETATKNLRWLRSMLSVRGIPGMILEQHLREISQAVREENRLPADDADRFAPFLSLLAVEREKLGGSELAEAIEEFSVKFADCGGLNVPDAARLIASAWLDEDVAAGAFSATLSWFTDSERFSTDWIDQANSLAVRLAGMRGAGW